MVDQLDRIRELISEYGISQTALAKKMEMADSTFRLKLSGDIRYRFIVNDKINEVEKLIRVIAELSNSAKIASRRDLVEV